MKKMLKKVEEKYWGNLSGMRGLAGVCGDLDEYEITEEDRARGVDVKELIQDDE